jgi:hypothetical protein
MEYFEQYSGSNESSSQLESSELEILIDHDNCKEADSAKR